MDVCERGNFEQKCQWAFDVYDLSARKTLDLVTLRFLVRKCFSEPMLQVEQACLIVKWKPRWTWEEFAKDVLKNLNTLPLL